MMFCRLYRWWIEKEIDDYGQIRNSGILEHLEKCLSCQGWLRVLKQIDRHLQTDSPGVSNLQIKQVQTAVHRHLSDATVGHIATAGHKTHKSFRFRYAISTVAAVIVVAIGLFSLYSLKPYYRNHNNMLDSTTQLSEQLQHQIPMLASLPEQLLDSKMQNMEMCVRHAVGFVKNCLPQGVIAANLSSENIDSQAILE